MTDAVRCLEPADCRLDLCIEGRVTIHHAEGVYCVTQYLGQRRKAVDFFNGLWRIVQVLDVEATHEGAKRAARLAAAKTDGWEPAGGRVDPPF